VYCGPIQLRHMGKRQLSGQLGLVPTCLATLLAFLFPWAIVASSFWCPWQCITATHLRAHTVSSSSRISCPYLILFPPELMSPSLYIRPHGHKWL
jgi:hypothetical protein